MPMIAGGDARYGGRSGVPIHSPRLGGHGRERTMPFGSVTAGEESCASAEGSHAAPAAAAAMNSRRVTPTRERNTGLYTNAMRGQRRRGVMLCTAVAAVLI